MQEHNQSIFTSDNIRVYYVITPTLFTHIINSLPSHPAGLTSVGFKKGSGSPKSVFVSG